MYPSINYCQYNNAPCGSHPEALHDSRSTPKLKPSYYQQKEFLVLQTECEDTIREKENTIQESIREKENTIREKEKTLQISFKRIIQEKENTIKDKEKIIREKEKALQSSEID